MSGNKLNRRSVPQTTTTLLKTTPNNNVSINNFNLKKNHHPNNINNGDITNSNKWSYLANASFLQWTTQDVLGLFKYHPVPCFFAVSLLFFMGVEYTLWMIPPSSPPFDIGFVATVYLHRVLESSPNLNTVLAGLNTVFVGMQTAYIIGTWVIEGRPRATVAALFMFTCRGILGYSTQLPLPEGFLGSGVDFPVGNVSFFLFFSGHVAGSVIASLDMRRMCRWELAFLFDTLNLLQVVRLLSTRGHYTIDLAVGVGAGMLFDSLAGKYMKNATLSDKTSNNNGDGLYTSRPLLS
uniref:phosphatidylcholine:diacylglycerol cholinephosphotransferase 1-like n=1 Tax=Erigeron canadensis TaxID=72917 RepID=UPI001CB98403|nr:phosphatidylcholine:diacylglycerol cholinephosphotransferase 1-like [Erigeron canadensis]